jgi:hypothetical protein
MCAWIALQIKGKNHKQICKLFNYEEDDKIQEEYGEDNEDDEYDEDTEGDEYDENEDDKTQKE